MVKVTNNRPVWHITAMMLGGLALIGATFIFAEFGYPFHYEFIIGGLALCGISITQFGDKR